MSSIVTIIAAVLGLLIVTGLLVLVRDVFQKLSGSGFVLLVGLVGLFAGERLFGIGTPRLAISAASIVVLLASLGLRAYAMMGSQGARKDGHRGALVATVVSLGSLALYALTLPSLTDALGFADDLDALNRWNGVWSSLFPIGVLGGVLPVLLIDRVLAAHPRELPMGAMRHAALSGVAMALAGALLFPVNYLASHYDEEWDLAYFRTTRPGESTAAIVQSASEPVEAILFYAAGNEVGQELETYFRAVQQLAGANFSYRRIDQALDPVLSEELKIRSNGVIVLRKGEDDQQIKISDEMDRAKRDLRKLDGKVNKSLTKLLKGSRDLYFLTGHGEASTKERDDPLRKLNLWKRDVLEAQSFKVKTFGVAEGSTQTVPEDAGVVVIAAPEEALLPEEVDTLVDWFEKGGALMVLLEPGGDPMTDLLARLGVESGTAPLANVQYHLKQSGQKADRVLLATNTFGSHASVKALSRNSSQMGLIVPSPVWVAKKADARNKVTTLVRTLEGTFEDLDGDREPDADEPAKVYELGVAVETPGEGEAQGRAIIVGDASLFADDVLRYSKGNVLFGSDTVRWLVGDEDTVGEINSEEDVKIQHTRQEDTAWFLLSIVGVPALVLIFGFVFTRLRRRGGS